MGYEADGFLANITAAPDDDGPRLIYADWLDEHGDPRGELIRVQVALARLKDHDPRRADLVRTESELLGRYADLWAAPFRGLATGPVFRRGFVEEVKVTARQFLAHPDELFHAGPVRHVHLLDAAGHLAALASPHLARLAGLTVFAQYLRDPLAQGLAASPHLAGLRALHVGRNHAGNVGAGRLATASLPCLEDLDLADNELTDLAGQALAAPGRFPRLVRLELAGNALGPAGAVAVAAAFPQLERLGLSGNRLGGRGFAGAGRPGLLLRPAAVDLSHTGLTADDIRRLFAGPTAGVRDLDLSGNRLEDPGAVALADAPSAAGLRRLRVNGAGLSDGGLTALAESPSLARLASLDVTNNPLSDEGFRALLRPGTLPRLARLAFSGIGLTVRMRLALERRYNRFAE